MKRNTILLFLLGAALLAGCSKEMSEDLHEPGVKAQDFTAIVTVHKSPTDTLYFQVDDTTRLYPRHFDYNYTGLERIVCGITVFNSKVPNYGYNTDVQWYDQLDKGSVSASMVPGTDGLDIISDWMTSCEDGFLTLHYKAWWGSGNVRHDFTLVTGQNPADPYELLLVHDANGDGHVSQGEAVVYFDINSLPDTGDSYKTLTLKWTDSGGKTAEKEFRFKTRKP